MEVELLIVAMAQTKGGSGKSTLAQSVAVEAAREGKSVLIVDLDPAQSAAKWWRRRGGPDNPALVSDVKNMVRLVELVGKTKADVVVLDTPGELMGVIRTAVKMAHVIVVPMAPSIKDWEAMDSVEFILDQTDKKARTLWVINRYRSRTEMSIDAKKSLHKRTGAVPLTVALATDHEKADAAGKTGAEINHVIAGEIGVLWEEIKRIGGKLEQVQSEIIS
jgi:chromosome partitioning protein